MLKTDTPHTSFSSCSLHIELHAYHTAWLKTSDPTCLCSTHSLHLHAINDVCLIVCCLRPRSVLLLFLSVVCLFSTLSYLSVRLFLVASSLCPFSVCLSFTYFFSSHLFLYSDLDSFFHVGNAKGNLTAAHAHNESVLPNGDIIFPQIMSPTSLTISTTRRFLR